MSTIDDIKHECRKAEARYGPFHSTHEGLGVLAEEYDELKQAIRANDRWQIRTEAIQVAAVALRIAQCLTVASVRSRSGLD